MTSSDLFIGIDTGGTYTDAVVIDAGRHRILASAKALTTKGDLSLGVIEAMTMAIGPMAQGFTAGQVKLVSVSTTLATNAVVEGHGSPVGVILAGFDRGMVERTGIAKAFPGIAMISVAGGHDHNGNAAQPLDETAVIEFVKSQAQNVSAFAVASSFAVRNGAHENRVRQLIGEFSGKPVTLSSDLASALDAPRRALTAVLNARLISRITQLVDAVRSAMAQLQISCPLLLMKGDGTVGVADAVVAKPIETVLSGPAASLVGAQWLSGLDDFIMSDMGGTTTDIGVLLKGRPTVAERGAEVGGWRTMVKAIDVKTIGLGGDSEVQIGVGGGLTIGPQRAVPLSLLGARFDGFAEQLEKDLAETEGGSLLGKFVLLPFGARPGNVTGLGDREQEIFEQVSDMPLALRRVAASSGGLRAVAALRKKGLVQFAAFTPSDAAHVLGLQDNWSASAAMLGAKLALRFREMKLPSDESTRKFCEEIWSITVGLSAKVLLEAGFGSVLQSHPLVDAVCRGEERMGLVSPQLSFAVPIVAVGGPVKVYYPEVARRLKSQVVFAPHCDVANAVGAAAGMVALRAVVTVEGNGGGVFRVLGEGDVEQFSSGFEALRAGQVRAEAAALRLALASGAALPQVSVSTEKTYLPEAQNDEGLLSAIITAEARGRPHLRD